MAFQPVRYCWEVGRHLQGVDHFHQEGNRRLVILVERILLQEDYHQVVRRQVVRRQVDRHRKEVCLHCHVDNLLQVNMVGNPLQVDDLLPTGSLLFQKKV